MVNNGIVEQLATHSGVVSDAKASKADNDVIVIHSLF